MDFIVIDQKLFNQLLKHFSDMEKQIMAVMDELKTAASNVTNAFNTLSASVTAAIQNAGSANDAEIAAVVTEINNLAQQMTTFASQLVPPPAAQ